MLYRGNKPNLQKPCFSRDQSLLKKCDESLPKEFFLKSSDQERDSYKFHHMPYSKNKPMFSRDENFFTDSDRGSPKKHPCKIW